MNSFPRKRAYPWARFLSDVIFLFFNFPHLLLAFGNREISSAFREKIMLVVTAVNGCPYCAWFHAQLAARSDINPEEIRRLLNLQFQADPTDFEVTGLLFAQHFAETDQNPDFFMTEKLYAKYGKTTAHHILLFIRVITMGNLLGNTFKKWKDQLLGLH